MYYVYPGSDDFRGRHKRFYGSVMFLDVASSFRALRSRLSKCDLPYIQQTEL